VKAFLSTISSMGIQALSIGSTPGSGSRCGEKAEPNVSLDICIQRVFSGSIITARG